MKKLHFNKNRKELSSSILDQKEEVKQSKQYEKFYNLVKKRLHTL